MTQLLKQTTFNLDAAAAASGIGAYGQAWHVSMRGVSCVNELGCVKNTLLEPGG
ncbi:MAG: hypothetical protein AB8B48_05380 [Pseudomonadales bacterium]